MTWDVSNYNTNPDLNTSINGHDISEGSAAEGYDDALRQIMADIAAWTQAYAVTYPIAVNKGGTGAITAAAALANLGALSSTYQHLPGTTKTASFNIDTTLDGGHVRYTGAAGSAGLAPNATYPFAVGAVVLLVNDGSGTLTIVPDAAVTLVWGATGGTGNRALAVNGMATLLQVAINRWFINGSGLS